MHFGDEVGEHFFCHQKIGDDAILERAYRRDVARGSSEHALGV